MSRATTGPREIRRLAIANRGEAALRCIRAARSLAARENTVLQTIALYTEVDRDAPFVRHADVAIELPSREGAVAAYLDHDGLIAACREAGADAVWPGWGFVAEDPDFADRVTSEGMVFLGPSGEAMRVLGDKIAAKKLAESAGVPVTSWSGGEVETEDDASAQAESIGYPVVIKASAGGGGRGIRIVHQPFEVKEAFRAARAEAEIAFAQYVHEADAREQAGQLKPGEIVNRDPSSGRVSVAGQISVMEINAKLAKLLFDKNPDRDFFVEVMLLLSSAAG